MALAMMSKILLCLTSSSSSSSQTHSNPLLFFEPISSNSVVNNVSRRILLLTAIATSSSTLVNTSTTYPASAETTPPNPSKSFLSGIANTKSWFQFYGDGFAIRVPPSFVDINDPDDYNQGLSLYGDRAKPKTYAARFASTDGSEVLSVVTRSTNQLKITFLEAKDITDLGTLKGAAKIFVPLGANVYSAHAFKIKEDDGYRNYYFYEFGNDIQRIALVAAVSSGKTIIAASTAPQNKWEDDGVRLRSAAVSLTLL